MNDVFAATGPRVIDLAGHWNRRLSLRVMSDGLMIIANQSDGDQVPIYCGAGSGRVKVSGPFVSLSVEPKSKLPWVIQIPELRTDEVGWLNSESYTDLDPKPFGRISPEVQAIMDQMNRNAIIREQAMLRALGNRRV